MDTTLLLLVIDDIGDAEGRRTWALGIGEDMELRDVQALDEAATLLEAVGGLTPAAHHHVHTDEGVGHLLLDQLHLVGEKGRVVATVHEAQHRVRPTLQGNVEMGHKGTAVGAVVYQFVAAEVGL